MVMPELYPDQLNRHVLGLEFWHLCVSGSLGDSDVR